MRVSQMVCVCVHGGCVYHSGVCVRRERVTQWFVYLERAVRVTQWFVCWWCISQWCVCPGMGVRVPVVCVHIRVRVCARARVCVRVCVRMCVKPLAF